VPLEMLIICVSVFFVYWGSDIKENAYQWELNARRYSYPMVRDKYQAKNSNKKQTGKMQEKGINLKGDYVNDTRTQWEKTSKYNYVRYFYFFALEIDVLPLCTFRPFSRYTIFCLIFTTQPTIQTYYVSFTWTHVNLTQF